MGLWEQIIEQMPTNLRLAGRLVVAEVQIDGGFRKASSGGGNPGETQRIADVA